MWFVQPCHDVQAVPVLHKEEMLGHSWGSESSVLSFLLDPSQYDVVQEVGLPASSECFIGRWVGGDEW